MPVECPKCHQSNSDNDEKCQACGTRLTILLVPVIDKINPFKSSEESQKVSNIPLSEDPKGGPALSNEAIAYLEVEGGQEIFFRGAYTTKVPLKGDSVLIGRRDVMANHYPDIDLMMYRKLDPAISRRHLRIFYENDDFFIEDLCNNNATFLNDYSNKLNHDRLRLKNGDRIFVSMSLALLFRSTN